MTNTVFEKLPDFEALFENKDKLTLTLNKNTTFAGYKPADIWELTYYEYQPGNYGDEEPTPGVHHFMCCNTEYFPGDKEDLAIQIFGYRAMSGNPSKESGKGFQLNSFLESDGTCNAVHWTRK